MMAIVRVPSKVIRGLLHAALKPVCQANQIELREIGRANQQNGVPAGEMVTEMRAEEFGRTTTKLTSGHASGPLAGTWEEITFTANYLLLAPLIQPNAGTTTVDLCRGEELADLLIEAMMNVQQDVDDQPSIRVTGSNMANAGRTEISPNRVALLIGVTGEARVR